MKTSFSLKNLLGGLFFPIALFLIVLIPSCKKSPTDGLKVIIDANVIKYPVLLDIRDAANNTLKPKDVNVTFSGPGSELVYESGGTKKFSVQNGFLNIGFGPGAAPTKSNPIKVMVTVSAKGYLAYAQELVVDGSEIGNVMTVKLINVDTPPAGLEIVRKSIVLTNGKVNSANTVVDISRTGPSTTGIKTESVSIGLSKAAVADQASLFLPDGTTFYYWKKGTAIGTRMVPKIGDNGLLASGNGNGSGNYTSYVEEEYKYTTYTYTAVTSGTILVDVIYEPSRDRSLLIHDSSWGTPSAQSFEILNGTKVPEENLLNKSASYLSLSYFGFTCEVANDDGTLSTVSVSPDKKFSWYISLALDPLTVNPITNKTIAAGDVIETGVDLTTSKTLRSTIREVTLPSGAKQLRSETQSIKAGYYYSAPFTSSFDFTFNTSAATPEIADENNLYAYPTITVSGNTLGYYSARRNQGIIRYVGKVASFNAIQISGQYNLYYWGKQFNSPVITGTTGTFNIFENLTSKVNVYPKVSVEVTTTCSKNNKVFLGQGYAYIYGLNTDGYGFAQLTQGKWQTNGLEPGKTYKGSVYSNNGEGTWEATINKSEFKENFVDKFDVCGKL